MSLRAMVWVLHDAPTKNHAEFAVLMALADRAGGDYDDGAAAYPSRAWIAEKVQCSVSTVKRHLKELERRGLIRRGDQRLVEKFRHDRRPVVWDLDLSLRRATGVQNDPPPKPATGQNEPPSQVAGVHSGQHEGSPVDERGSNGERTGGHSYDPQTILNHPVTVLKPSTPPEAPQGGQDVAPGQQPGSDYPAAFEDWYERYPRKKSKRAALKAWEKATKRISADDLNEFTDRFAAWGRENQKDPQFLPYPATWLNSDGWEDDLSETKQASNSFLNAVRQRNQQPAQEASRPAWADAFQLGGGQ